MRTLTRLMAAAVAALAAAAAAQDYPAKPVRIVTTPVASGGDIIAREMAAVMAGPLGAPIVVENRPALAAIELVAKSPPDGYTILINGSVIWIQPLLQKTTPWDAVRDFTPITLLARSPNLLVVTPSVPAKSVQELIALARAKPGSLSYASAGPGSSSQLAAELFKSMAGGLNIVHVPYKGAGPAMVDLMEGRVQIGFVVTASVIGQVKTGKLRPLAITSREPSILAEGMPTVAESGLPGYESVLMLGAFAPAGTSPAIVERLHREMVRVLANPGMKQKLIASGAEVVGGTGEELLAAGKADVVRWRKVITEAHITLD